MSAVARMSRPATSTLLESAGCAGLRLRSSGEGWLPGAAASSRRLITELSADCSSHIFRSTNFLCKNPAASSRSEIAVLKLFFAFSNCLMPT